VACRLLQCASVPHDVMFASVVAKLLRAMQAQLRNVSQQKRILADGVWRAQTHHCTKFRQSWSFHCGNIAISRIFKMATTILDFSEITKFVLE